MVDRPGRLRLRFPAEQVRDQLERCGVGPGTTFLTGGAHGADIIAAEAALERGVAVRLVLAREPGDFVSDSVSLLRRTGRSGSARSSARLTSRSSAAPMTTCTRGRTSASSSAHARSTITRSP
jgi:hypothetical protein